ncbi:MAG TPA: plastocyanin/azurin family copper-binding protein [bacterium]|nr:plastocyanin/azurin family copper-binding protein [bacterium]
MERLFPQNRIDSRLQALSLAGAVLAMAAVFLMAGCNKETTAPETGALFSSGDVGAGETFFHTFKEAGTFPYYCEIHQPDMKGTIVVQQGFGGPDTATVTMENIQFHPQQDTVAPNTSVQWVNQDNENHTVVSGTPSMNNNGGGNSGGGGYYSY